MSGQWTYRYTYTIVYTYVHTHVVQNNYRTAKHVMHAMQAVTGRLKQCLSKNELYC